MDSSFFLGTVAAAIGFFTLFRKFRPHQENKEIESSSSSSPPPSFSSPSSTLSPLSITGIHDVFPSFRGEDVRKDFLSHIQKEFQRKGITPFIDNNIKRGDFIGPELIRAIRGSKIAIVLLSKNYASSSWCLDELVEIMKCKEELGQTVIAVFYKVDPSHVKKLTGDFGKVFRNSCKGKKRENNERWREAFAKIATIAGYDSSNWDNEAEMIEKIVCDISKMVNHSMPSHDFSDLIGMENHMKLMEPLLRLDLEEVRMIGIWGPPGIGKTTIARVLFSQLSNHFQLSVFMESVKSRYTMPTCSDDYSEKLHLQQLFMSQITSQKDIQIPHLGVARNRLNDKKVLVVLDDVNQLVQLDAMAKNTWWFGPGSRIIITTQDRGLLRAHGTKYIYGVDYPIYEEALQIFCMHAFGQKTPCDGFEKLSREVTKLSGELPLGLKVMGSYLRGMSKHEWIEALPRLRTHLDGKIESVLKFSYEALCDVDRDLFLHIACFFNGDDIMSVEGQLGNNFLDVRQGLRVLAEKSLISIIGGKVVSMHNQLEKLGIEIVRKQSIHEPWKRQFLVDGKDIREVLTDETGSGSVLGINFNLYEIKNTILDISNGKDLSQIISDLGSRTVLDTYFNIYETKNELTIGEKAFNKMSNLQFLRVHGGNILHLPQGLNYIPGKLRLLHWKYFPMTSFPTEFHTEFLVKLFMPQSKLEKLWEGIQPLKNLRWMDLSDSKYLKEIPDLSTATNLQELSLDGCTSLVELPSSIGNINNLEKLGLYGCSSLVELSIGKLINIRELNLSYCSNLLKLPDSIGNATNLQELNLIECSSLVELPFTIGNLHKLQRLNLKGCSKLEALPTNINLESLSMLVLTDCSLLKVFPKISTNIEILKLDGAAIEEVTSSVLPRLDELHLSDCENLKDFPHAFVNTTELHLSGKETQETPPWIKRFSCLRRLILNKCRKLVSLPHIPDSLKYIYADTCESLETLGWSSFNSEFVFLNFDNCFKLNKEARDLIIQTLTSEYAILPGEQVPLYFTYQAIGDSVTVKLNERPFPTSFRFKVCILLAYKGNSESYSKSITVCPRIMNKQNGLTVTCRPVIFCLDDVLKDHLCIFEDEAQVEGIFRELVFEFKVSNEEWWQRECGVQLQGVKESEALV